MDRIYSNPWLGFHDEQLRLHKFLMTLRHRCGFRLNVGNMLRYRTVVDCTGLRTLSSATYYCDEQYHRCVDVDRADGVRVAGVLCDGVDDPRQL